MNQHDSAVIRRPRSDDRPLRDIYWGAFGYFAIHIAHSVGVFPLLADGPRTLAEVCQALGLKRRAAEAILAVCVSHGLLTFNLDILATGFLLPGLKGKELE
jgi:hypothetical protein